MNDEYAIFWLELVRTEIDSSRPYQRSKVEAITHAIRILEERLRDRFNGRRKEANDGN